MTDEKYQKLNPLEIRERLSGHEGWSVEDGRLEKEYRFANFARAMIFLNKIVNPIEEHENYPRITLSYDRIQVSLFTNTVGSLTKMDVEMAVAFDEIFS